MILVGGYVNLTTIAESLGITVSRALLSLHALTGCDTTGKFAVIGKRTWVKCFLLAIKSENFLSAMSTFENGHSESIIPTFASFVCCVYQHPRITKTMTEEVFDLSSTRYYLFQKCAAEGKKLPPRRGAFLMHVKRAYVQLKIWS